VIDIVKGRYWDKSWGLVSGCTPVSPACDNYWLRVMDHRFHREGPVTFREDRLSIPFETKKPTVFAVWSDLFHEAVTDTQVDMAFIRMYICPHHAFLVLTKRPDRMREWIKKWIKKWADSKPLSNLWLGVTAENQEQADKRIPILLSIPAAHRWVSIEPMLGAIDLERGGFSLIRSVKSPSGRKWPGLDLVILGGETGPGARPMRPDWVRSVRDQCASAGVPFFFKGWGKNLDNVAVSDMMELGASLYARQVFHTTYEGQRAGRLLDGRTHDYLPWRAK